MVPEYWHNDRLEVAISIGSGTVSTRRQSIYKNGGGVAIVGGSSKASPQLQLCVVEQGEGVRLTEDTVPGAGWRRQEPRRRRRAFKFHLHVSSTSGVP